MILEIAPADFALPAQRQRESLSGPDLGRRNACAARRPGGAALARRAAIGDRLALLPDGDRRPGVELRADGVPDIVWHAIPGGEVRWFPQNAVPRDMALGRAQGQKNKPLR